MKSTRSAMAATRWLSRPGGVAERPGQCIVGHDARARPRWTRRTMARAARQAPLAARRIAASSVIAGQHLVGQPQRQAIDQHRRPRRTLEGRRPDRAAHRGAPALAAPRPVHGDALGHLVVKGLRGRDVGPGRRQRRDQRLGMRALAGARTAEKKVRLRPSGKAFAETGDGPMKRGRTSADDAPERHPEDQVGRWSPPPRTGGAGLPGSAIRGLTGCGAPTTCGATISATPTSDKQRACPGSAISASPAAVARDRRHPPDLAVEKIGGWHGRQFRRQAEAGASVNTAKPANPQNRPWRQLAMPPANSDAATRISAKPMPLTMLASGGVGEALEAVGRRPGFFAHARGERPRRARLDRHGGSAHGRAPARRHSRRSRPAGSAARWRSLQHGQDHAGQQAGERRDEHDVAKQRHDVSLPSVAGESHGMAIVVGGVVDDFHMREADEADDEQAEQSGEAELGRARGRLTTATRERKKPYSFHVPFALHPRASRMFRRRQVSWLADRRPPRLPEVSPQWLSERATAYSCGAAAALDRKPSPHSLSVLPEPPTRKTIGQKEDPGKPLTDSGSAKPVATWLLPLTSISAGSAR